jgi:hypothetical protein
MTAEPFTHARREARRQNAAHEPTKTADLCRGQRTAPPRSRRPKRVAQDHRHAHPPEPKPAQLLAVEYRRFACG